jgi:hypothetical protein
MKKTLEQRPLFLLLLPLFFVWHGFVANFGFIPFSDCLLLMAIYGAAAIVLGALAWLILKNRVKAALLASFVMAFFLFFGYFHDMLRKHAISLHRYTILLPLFLFALILLTIYLKKRTRFAGACYFVNLLLLIYLIVDSGTLLWKAAGHTRSGYSAGSFSSGRYKACDTCSKPDIYFLLFDGYSSSSVLKDLYHYDDSALDDFLLNEGFQIQRGSRSNYFKTPFSMASILNFSYLKGVPDPHNLTADDYTNLFEVIGNSEVVRFLSSRGYEIFNNSPFDLPGTPSSLDQPFIPAKTRLITNGTLAHYLARDLGFWISTHTGDSAVLVDDFLAGAYRNNMLAIDRTVEISRQRSDHPRFVYAHVFMPHYPYLMDSLSRKRDPQVVVRQLDEMHPGVYLDYLPFTNFSIKRLLSSILKNSGGKAVIVFMSDHGFRHPEPGNSQLHFFNNQNAVYFPDRDYHLLYDSMSAVNEFPILFNKLFRQNLPLSKDSLIYLRDKE